MFQLVDTTYGQKIAHLYIIKPGMYLTKKLTCKFPHNAKKKKQAQVYSVVEGINLHVI